MRRFFYILCLIYYFFFSSSRSQTQYYKIASSRKVIWEGQKKGTLHETISPLGNWRPSVLGPSSCGMCGRLATTMKGQFTFSLSTHCRAISCEWRSLNFCRDNEVEISTAHSPRRSSARYTIFYSCAEIPSQRALAWMKPEILSKSQRLLGVPLKKLTSSRTYIRI